MSRARDGKVRGLTKGGRSSHAVGRSLQLLLADVLALVDHLISAGHLNGAARVVS